MLQTTANCQLSCHPASLIYGARDYDMIADASNEKKEKEKNKIRKMTYKERILYFYFVIKMHVYFFSNRLETTSGITDEAGVATIGGGLA